jgi:hypothetical protein
MDFLPNENTMVQIITQCLRENKKKNQQWIIEWFTYNDNFLVSNVVKFIASSPNHMWSLAQKQCKRKMSSNWWTSN